ncbi:MAG: trypsin-like peptidase domain-containing protein [Chitinophagaceae bacterium]
MTFKQSLVTLALGAGVIVAGAAGYKQYQQTKEPFTEPPSHSSSVFKNVKYSENGDPSPVVDFEKAAAKGAPAVVHIKTVMKARQAAEMPGFGDDNPFKDFFGPGFGGKMKPESMPSERASGSGVLISEDGYIVTNNHVVDQATEVNVTINDKGNYKAKVIGTDPSSDLAVIKIEGHNLPYLTFANSDDVHLGQWVMAIGYPLNLGTTVTSGIVSAKSRSIGINSRNSNAPIESFIQTDAAVNPGNSGGALVNLDGNVIGINSAIASPTGSYAGYSYAIPSNLVQKVASDIVKYGSNKRAYLGVMYPNDQMSEEDREKNNVKDGDGVYVMDVAKGSAAEEAGVQKGDFITKVNGATVNTGTEMVEKISSMRPGDKITITYQHGSDSKTATATLKGSTGTYASMKEQVIEQLGAAFEPLDKSKAAAMKLSSGVVVKKLGQGIITDQTRIREGFIITRVNDTKVSTVEELKDALKAAGNSAIITGVYPSNPAAAYQYALNDLNGAE